MPLSRRGISHLAGNSFGLDLYSLFAHRLRRLTRPLHLNWQNLQSHIGADYASSKAIARRVREVLPEVRVAYPEADVDITTYGLTLKPSKPAVPERTIIPGHRFETIARENS